MALRSTPAERLGTLGGQGTEDFPQLHLSLELPLER